MDQKTVDLQFETKEPPNAKGSEVLSFWNRIQLFYA